MLYFNLFNTMCQGGLYTEAFWFLKQIENKKNKEIKNYIEDHSEIIQKIFNQMIKSGQFNYINHPLFTEVNIIETARECCEAEIFPPVLKLCQERLLSIVFENFLLYTSLCKAMEKAYLNKDSQTTVRLYEFRQNLKKMYPTYCCKKIDIFTRYEKDLREEVEKELLKNTPLYTVLIDTTLSFLIPTKIRGK